MNFENILFTVEQNVATIQLNRPETLNAVDLTTAVEVASILEQCSANRGIRAVVLTGTGKAFCSGGDVKYFAGFLEGDPTEPFRNLTHWLHRIIVTIRLMPKPVVAAVNGTAAGAGLSLALACDLRIAAADARFKQAYTGVGLVPDGAWSLWVSLLAGLGRASEMIFLDPLLDVDRALQMGLVHRVVPPEKLHEETMELAARLAAGPTRAYALAKASLNRAMLGLLEHQLEVERQAIVSAAGTKDFREGLAAFLAKRTPDFRGE